MNQNIQSISFFLCCWETLIFLIRPLNENFVWKLSIQVAFENPFLGTFHCSFLLLKLIFFLALIPNHIFDSFKIHVSYAYTMQHILKVTEPQPTRVLVDDLTTKTTWLIFKLASQVRRFSKLDSCLTYNINERALITNVNKLFADSYQGWVF